jgi:hypothetical protein
MLLIIKAIYLLNGGERGIRTLGAREDTLTFQASPFDHSGTSPHCYHPLPGKGMRRVDQKRV